MKAWAKKWYRSHTRNQCCFKQQTVKISLYFSPDQYGRDPENLMWLQKCSTYEIGIKRGIIEKWLLRNCTVNTKYTEISVEQHKNIGP